MVRIASVGEGSLEGFYEVAARMARRCLAEGRSLLTDRSVWNLDVADDLLQRVVGNPDWSKATFDDKLLRQLEGASDDVRLLAAELRLLHLLPMLDVAGAAKRAKVEALLPAGLQLGDEVAAALSTGLVRWGAGHARLSDQYALLIRVLVALGRLEVPVRAEVVGDPWRFKALVQEQDDQGAHMQSEALLFLVHPDTFDAVFNPAHKDAIVSRFSDGEAAEADRDRALLSIRRSLESELGTGFSWYDEQVAARWRAPEVSASSVQAGPPLPSGEVERRRLRLAHWSREVQDWYRRHRDISRMARPTAELTARVASLAAELPEAEDPFATYFAALGDEQPTSALRHGAFRVFVAGFLREGGREAVELLAEVLTPPASFAEARTALRSVHDLASRVGTSQAPTANNGPLVVAGLWSLQDPDRFAPLWWARQHDVLAWLGWLPATDDYVDKAVGYLEVVGEIADDVWLAGFGLSSAASGGRFLGLDPTLAARAAENQSAAGLWRPGVGYGDQAVEDRSEANAAALVGELRVVKDVIHRAVVDALDTRLTSRLPRLRPSADAPFRSDAFLTLVAPGTSRTAASFRVWVGADGIWVGALVADRPAQVPDGLVRVAVTADSAAGGHRFEPDVAGHEGAWLVGRRLDADAGLGTRVLLDEITETAGLVAPLLRTAWGLDGLAHSGPRARASTLVDDRLAAAVERWQTQMRYPTEADRAERDHLDELTRRLAPVRLDSLDLDALRELVTAEQQGSAPTAEAFLRRLRGVGGAELGQLARSVHHLLWSTDDPAVRFDAAHGLDGGGGGLSSEVLRRLLSCAPGGWLPILDLEELERHASKLGLEVALTEEASLGQRNGFVDAAIQAQLQPVFGADAVQMAAFLRWYASASTGDVEQADPLEAAADELYLPREWVETVVQLLQDKGQVILYGPPGTGKTFVAQRLAAALTTIEEDRWLVQFHPSTSYEDFFEGYRPTTDERGQLSYELTAGPLARAARHAAANLGRDHVLIIDEINRANLPRVFGELLFLLEYREHSIHTLYRASQPFRLPPNLLVIGTMNTADRSIAMIDAALRRRFHFVPMFPHEPPLRELLARWGSEHGLDRRWSRLLEMVNDELIADLGGPDLQVGPSHLMRPVLDAQSVERIWTYSIFPYIEDQLFGQADAIASYRWPAVIGRLDRLLAAEAEDLGEPDGYAPVIAEQD